MSSRISSSPERLVWDPSLSVGIPEIDAEHEYTIYLINCLNDAIIDGATGEEILRHLRLIVEDASRHFAHEEALFAQWSYPELGVHAEKHAQILLMLNETVDRFGLGCNEQEMIECGLDIKGALIEHLLAEDMKYADYHERRQHRPG